MTKYRLRRRAHGWALQRMVCLWGSASESDHWERLAIYRWRWVARVALLALRLVDGARRGIL